MVTIILITYNRPEYLRRLLQYFCYYGVKHQIFVGDASEPEALHRNKDVISEFDPVMNISHLIYPNSSDTWEVVHRCIEKTETKYVLWVADDDFIVPTTLDMSVDFLERNPSYETARGRQIGFVTGSDGPHSRSVNIFRINWGDDLATVGMTGADRIRKRMAQNTRYPTPFTTFALMRTHTAKRLFQEIMSLGLDHPNTESTLSHLLMIAGNSKLINRLFSIRQGHGGQQSHSAHGKYVPILTASVNGPSYEPINDLRGADKLIMAQDFYDILNDPLFSVKQDRKTRCITDELMRHDGLSWEQSDRIVKYWNAHFWAKELETLFYSDKGYQGDIVGNGGQSLSMRLKSWIKHTPGLEQARQKLRSVTGGEVSLRHWLHPNLSLYTDLRPFYRSINTLP